jgi:hypothetical protein
MRGERRMTVFDVYLNDRRICRAGVGGDGVLSAIVSWTRLTGAAVAEARRRKRPREEARLHVGGLADNSHVSWSDRDLRTGDRVGLVLGQSGRADPPATVRRRNAADDERRERAYYLRLKEKFEPPASGSPKPAGGRGERTQFLNVDVELRSSRSLQPLVDALGKRVIVLRLDREARTHCAHLELSVTSRNPDVLIRRFVRLIERLPRATRAQWDSATAREFNIGIQAGANPHGFPLQLEADTLRAVVRVDGRVGITVYGTGERRLKSMG